MAIWDWFKPNKDISFDRELFKEKLSPYVDPDTIDEILDDLNLESVHEKTEIPIDEFGEAFSSELGSLYTLPTKRLQIARVINNFISENAEVFNSLRLTASFICYGATELKIDDYKVVIITDDNNKRRKAQKAIDNFDKESKIKRKIYLIAKDLVSFGDAWFEKIRDTKNKNGKLISVGYIPSNSIVIKKNDTGDEIEKVFQIKNKSTLDKLIGTTSDKEKAIYEEYVYASPKDKVIAFDPDETLHFTDGTLPGMSDSPFLNLAIVWKALKFLEESLIIHRLTRARRLILFFLDVGGKTGVEVKKAVRSFKEKLSTVFKLNKDDGMIYKEKSVTKGESDVIIPITKNSKTDVKSIPSDPSATNIDDLKFYYKRVLANLFMSHLLGSEKAPNIESIEKALNRLIRTYQKNMAYALEDLYGEILTDNDIEDVTVSIVFPSPDTDEEIKLIDTILRRVMVMNQLLAILDILPPQSWIIEYVFKDLSQTEIHGLLKMIEAERQKQEEEAIQNELVDIFSDIPNKGDNNDFIELYEKTKIQTKEEKEAYKNYRIERLEKMTEQTINFLRMEKTGKKPSVIDIE